MAFEPGAIRVVVPQSRVAGQPLPPWPCPVLFFAPMSAHNGSPETRPGGDADSERPVDAGAGAESGRFVSPEGGTPRRFAIHGRLASGGMASVHFGRIELQTGEVRAVALKRLHPQFCKDPDFVGMFIDEARLAARIKHPNVVETLDVLTDRDEIVLVMEYIRGECFSKLLRAGRKRGLLPSLPVVSSIVAGMLRGLHAAHEVTGEHGQLLGVVHRDVSPQNIMVGLDGVTRVLDFGVAKASARVQVTRDGQMKGKLSYMSPEQLQGRGVDRRADIFATGAVLWESLTQRRLFAGEDAGGVLQRILSEEIAAPSSLVEGLSSELDALVLKALAKNPDERHATALEMAEHLESALPPASPQEVADWVHSVASEILDKRDSVLAEIRKLGSEKLTALGATASSGRECLQRIQAWVESQAHKDPPRREGGVQAEPATPPEAEPLPEAALSIDVETPGSAQEVFPPAGVAEVRAPAGQRSPYEPAAKPSNRGVTFSLGLVAGLTVAAVVVFLWFSGPGGGGAVRQDQQALRPASPAEPLLKMVPVPAAETPSEPQPEPPAATPPRPKRTRKPASKARDRRAKVKRDRTAGPAVRKGRSKRRKAPEPVPAEDDSVDCREPYWVDENGIRRLKLACL